jgi:outer membrane protein assembly factor BamB
VLYAVSSIGGLDWSYRTADAIYSSSAVDFFGVVYLGSLDNQIYAFNSMGDLKWSYQHPDGGIQGNLLSSPVISGEDIYVQARRRLLAFNSDGSVKWTFTVEPAPSYAHYSSPAVGDSGRIYWGTGTARKVYSVDSDGAFRWSYTTDGQVQASPAIGYDESIYIGSHDNYFYAFTSEGALSWSFLTINDGYDVVSSAAVDTSGNVYVGSRDNRIRMFTSAGAFGWSYEAAYDIMSSPAIGSDGIVYIGSQDKKLYALNSNGTLDGCYITGAQVNSSPSIGSDGLVYVGSDDLNIYALETQDPTDTPTPKPTNTPTETPTITPTPTDTPTGPTPTPTETPTETPTPTITPTISVIWSPLPDGPWPMFRRFRDHGAKSGNYAVECHGALAWIFQTDGNITSSPVQSSDGNVYVGSEDNMFYAFSATGELEWTYETADPIFSSPAIDSVGNVYIGSQDNQFYAFNATGGLRWSYNHPGGATEDHWESSPVIDATGLIYLQPRWSVTVLNSVGSMVWSFRTNAAGTAHSSSPALGPNGEIYWGTGDECVLYAVKSNWALGWTYVTGGTIESSPAVGSDGTILIGSYDNNIYAITSAGALSWTYETADDVYSSPAIDELGNVYVGSKDNAFRALTSAGALSWSYLSNGADINSSPAIDARGWVYVGAQDDKIYAFEPDGTLIWTYYTGASVNSSPAIGSGGRLYVGSNDNSFYAIGTAAVTYTLYGNDTGVENWVAVPFCDSGIETTADLGDAIEGLSPTDFDCITIVRKIGSTQALETTTGYYDTGVPGWGWTPVNGYDIVIGAMYKVTITLAGGEDEGELTITGCACPLEFTIYDTASGSENWISVPWTKWAWYLDKTTVDLGEWTAYWWPGLDYFDQWIIDLWDVELQTKDRTTGDYDPGVPGWGWTPEIGYDIWPGLPFIVIPPDKGTNESITWP